MVFLNPLVVIIGMIIYIIPYLWPVSFAITMFVYHILLKNRDEHLKRLEIIFKSKKIDIKTIEKIKKDNSLKVLFGYVVSFTGFYIIFIKLSNKIETIYSQISSIEDLQNFENSLPASDTFLFFLFLFLVWFTYTRLISRIIKDQFFIQNIEIQQHIIDSSVLKYRDANFVMFLRIITFNLYEWFLLISLIRETNTLYITDGTYKIENENQKQNYNVEELAEKRESDFEILNPDEFASKEEFLSYLYAQLSKLDGVNRIKRINELLEKNVITKEDVEKIKKLL
ncbi:MAG: hypothetical protein B6I29_01895 [Marinitoga sp. 4572_148]|nr:MAG: hypothetical protein B6I29_01895 [Marinitoga sp. 4572_148]